MPGGLLAIEDFYLLQVDTWARVDDCQHSKPWPIAYPLHPQHTTCTHNIHTLHPQHAPSASHNTPALHPEHTIPALKTYPTCTHNIPPAPTTYSPGTHNILAMHPQHNPPLPTIYPLCTHNVRIIRYIEIFSRNNSWTCEL